LRFAGLEEAMLLPILAKKGNVTNTLSVQTTAEHHMHCTGAEE
jgi:hypothetical protein